MIQLFNADCLEKMKDISSNSVDLVICDLPFGCLSSTEINVEKGGKYQKGGKAMSACAWDVKIDLEAFWKEVKRIRRNDHSPCLHFTTTKYGFELWESNKKEFRYDLVWDKGRGVSFLSANKMPMRSHEMIYVFSKAGAYYNRVDISGNFPQGGGGDRKNASVYGTEGIKHTTPAGRRCVKSVILSGWKDCKSKGKHPTEKPIELYKFLIERYCPTAGTVLDPTFGSCNSGLACQELGRNYIGIEMNQEFYEKARKRFG